MITRWARALFMFASSERDSDLNPLRVGDVVDSASRNRMESLFRLEEWSDQLFMSCNISQHGLVRQTCAVALVVIDC